MSTRQGNGWYRDIPQPSRGRIEAERVAIGRREFLLSETMTRRRLCLGLASCFVATAAGTSSWGQTALPKSGGEEPSYALRDQRAVGELARVKLTFSVKGTLQAVRANDEGATGTIPTLPPAKSSANAKGTAVKPATISANDKGPTTAATIDVPMSATSRMLYDERILELGRRSARIYRHCDAELSVADQQIKRILRPDRVLVTSNIVGNLANVSGVTGALTREELDLLEVHGNSLLIYGMLPADGAKKVGDKWSIAAEVMAGLLNLDGADSADVTAQLAEVTQGLALVQFSGSVAGYVDGVSARVELKGDLRFDLNWGRISWFQMTVREQREPNPTGPGFDVAAELRMLIEPSKGAAELGKAELKQALQTIPATAPLIEMDASRLGMRWHHDRTWHVTNEMTSSLIMRRVVDGDIMAQCHVSQLPQLAKGKRQSLEEFQAEVQKALGERFSRFELARQEERNDKCQILRVDAVGLVADVPIHWRYYNLQHPNGQRAALVFTMKEDHLKSFGETDQQMVVNFEFLPVSQVAAKEKR